MQKRIFSVSEQTKTRLPKGKQQFARWKPIRSSRKTEAFPRGKLRCFWGKSWLTMPEHVPHKHQEKDLYDFHEVFKLIFHIAFHSIFQWNFKKILCAKLFPSESCDFSCHQAGSSEQQNSLRITDCVTSSGKLRSSDFSMSTSGVTEAVILCK